MNSITASTITIQTSSQSQPSTPCWLGEVVLLVQHLRQQGVLSALSQQVRFARRCFGHYEVIDFVAVLFGYAISGERTLEALACGPRSRPQALQMGVLSSDRLVSPSGTLWLLASASLRFLSSAACFSLFTAFLPTRLRIWFRSEWLTSPSSATSPTELRTDPTPALCLRQEALGAA
ncbi:hypothetical protein [Reticulibacter mediterranei]|uniref:hypothetical protein n=1 Tax=Reticulibacter mediterranei TaxID=2778369 RepID=UPI001C692950|nr:hypothetical protein [Reticulibacter mediterranei]